MRGPCRCTGGMHKKGHFGMMGHGRRGFMGRGKMGFGKMGHGKMGHHKKGWIFKFMVHSKMLKKKLGLTPDQIAKLKALGKKHKEQMRAFRLKKRRAKTKAMVELLKDKPDVAKLKALFKPVLEAKAAKMHAKLDMKISFIQIFTTEQWRKIISSRWFGRGRKGMGRHGRWGKMGMGRHGRWGRKGMGHRGRWGRKWRGHHKGKGGHGPCPECAKRGRPCPTCAKKHK